MSDKTLRPYYATAIVRITAFDAEEANAILDEAQRQGLFQINPNLYGSILCNRMLFEVVDDMESRDQWDVTDIVRNGSDGEEEK